jgi:hypothetical protein
MDIKTTVDLLMIANRPGSLMSLDEVQFVEKTVGIGTCRQAWVLWQDGKFGSEIEKELKLSRIEAIAARKAGRWRAGITA